MLNITRQDHHWLLEGELTFSSLSREAKKWCARFPKASEKKWHLDCKALTKIDSCGLAFLLACRRHAQQHNLAVHIAELPRMVETLTEAQGISTLLSSER